VTRKFDEIVAFAELEKFIETPVKRYSSGMYMRLAFAVAAYLETEILLVDEVLAVGDILFQKKCLGKMDDISKEGRTVLFISHNMGAIRQLCNDAILLEAGRIQSEGKASEIASEYENYGTANIENTWVNNAEEDRNQVAYIEKVEVQTDTFQSKAVFLSSENIYIVFTVVVSEENQNFKIGFDLVRKAEVVFRTQQVDSPRIVENLSVGRNKLICQIPANLLSYGDYYIRPIFSLHLIRMLYAKVEPVVKFNVLFDTSRSAFHMVLNEKNHPGSIFPQLNWEKK